MVELLPCPFCQGGMKVGKHTAFHPENDCLFATAGDYGQPIEIDESDYAAWNRRSVPATQEAVGLRTQDVVDYIVREMTEMGYPVEMTHKSGFKSDHIPTDWLKCADREEEIAMCLVEGYESKRAFVSLIYLLLKDRAALAASGHGKGGEHGND